MLDSKILSYFPFQFTIGQQFAIDDIRGDLASGQQMSRLLHADVGAGKTAVAFFAAMGCAIQGKRTLILCPTTILAAQHYETLKSMGWDDVGLYSSGRYDARSASVMIGTHAMLNNDYLIASASLVIIDEFQKFGVEQRAKATKHHPHLLLLSATPIPRSLTATVFGDLDVSVIRQLPIVRGTVVTKWVLPDKREAMYEIIEKELAAGHQVYFVYPRICGGEDVVSAERGFKELSERFGNHWCSLLTGKCGRDEKHAIMLHYTRANTKILVSTIIAEVGLDNPNATIMVVEGADRFGLSQLHQLRGRVCRSTDTAFCFLVSETSNPTSIARLEVIEKCNCGFQIAEEDLRLRGAGEVFSTRQSGFPDLKFISLVDDFDLMQEARDLVQSGSVGDGPKEMMQIKYEGLLQFGDAV